MARKTDKPLIEVDDVDQVLDRQTTDDLADIIGLTPDQRKELGDLVRAAARRYLNDIGRPEPADVRDAIEGLGMATVAAYQDPTSDAKAELAARRLSALSEEALLFLRQVPNRSNWLQALLFLRQIPNRSNWLPTPNDILAPETRQEALNAVAQLCISGARRERQGTDDQGNPTSWRVRRTFRKPTQVGHSGQLYSYILCVDLGAAYEILKGKPPGRSVGGPFAELARTVFSHLGLRRADHHLKTYFKEMKPD